MIHAGNGMKFSLIIQKMALLGEVSSLESQGVVHGEYDKKATHLEPI